MRAGRVAQRLEGMQDDFFGEGLRGVVGAGVPPRGSFLDHQAAVEHDNGPSAQVQAHQTQPGQDPVAKLGVVADSLGRAR